MEPRLQHRFTTRQYITFLFGGLILLVLPFIVIANRTKTTNRSFAAGYAAGDVNHDGKVNLDDLAIIRETIVSGRYSKDADLNHDGRVDEKDIQFFFDALSLRK